MLPEEEVPVVLSEVAPWMPPIEPEVPEVPVALEPELGLGSASGLPELPVVSGEVEPDVLG